MVKMRYAGNSPVALVWPDRRQVVAIDEVVEVDDESQAVYEGLGFVVVDEPARRKRPAEEVEQ